MDERQAFMVIRNVLRLEGLASDLAKASTQELKSVLDRVKAIVEGMPEGSVERELAYKQIQGLIRNMMQVPAVRLSDDVLQGLQQEAEYQVEWGAKYVNAAPGEVSSIQAAAQAAVGDTRVLNKSVDVIAGPLSTAQWKRVDKTVRAGFLEGLTNSQIAKQIGETYTASKAELRAITRTAVMSMAQESHNQFWDANDEAIAGWTWDASMDYRVCPICAPLDGREVEKRKDLPAAPAHPNCRCMVLPITNVELERRKNGTSPTQGDRTIIELRKEKPKETDTVRVYKKKVRGEDGQMYWRVVTKVPAKDGQALSMGGFINRANADTQKSVLGAGRAERFRKLVAGGTSPEEALRRVTNDVAPKVTDSKAISKIKPKPKKAIKKKATPKKAAPAKAAPKKEAPAKAAPKKAAPKKTSLKEKLAASKAKTAAAKQDAAKAIKKTEELKAKVANLQQLAAKEKEYKELNNSVLLDNKKGPELKALIARTKKVRQEIQDIKMNDPFLKAQEEKKIALEKKLEKTNKLLEKAKNTLEGKKPTLTAAEKALKPPRAALKAYTGSEFAELKAVQFVQAKKAGAKLSNFEQSQVDLHGSDPRLKRYAGQIESYLDRAPKYKGNVYRSLNIPEENLQELIAKYKKGEKSHSMESWTSNEELEFNMGGDQQVLLRTANKRGVDVRRLSEFESEDEVLMPAGSGFKLKGIKKEEISRGLTKEGIYRWTIDLEPI